MARPKSKIYYAVAYLRLSREDGDKGESNSITNQKKLIQEYVSKSKDIKLVGEFQDDGFTGTNFNRPGFQNLMEMLEKGKADCVIVKDLSRLGRDYIETGKYIEKVFPSMGVRFIALNDNVDSLNRDVSDEIVIPFKNLINDSYCRELSNKLRIQYKTQRKNGEFIGNFACFGYMKAPDDKHKLIIDEEAAQVVRLIYAKRIEGYSCKNIAGYLNTMGFLSPSDYKVSKGHNYKCGFKQNTVSKWGDKQVRRILTNRVYVGDLEQGKRGTPNYKIKKMQEKKKEDWIIVEGMHEAIVSKEEFELAQAVIRGGEKNPKRNLRYYPLKGLVCCGNCKRALTRRKLRNESGYFYQCTHSTHDRDTDCPVGERYSEAWIEDTAYKAIGQMLTLVEKKAVKEHEISKRRKSTISECADAIRDLQKQYEQLKAVKLRLYEKYTSGSITKAEYLKRKAETDTKMSENEEAIQRGHQRMQELDSEHPCSDERLDAVLGEYQKGEGLTYELAHALISAIYVHGHDSIEIVWKFKDIFEKAEIK